MVYIAEVLIEVGLSRVLTPEAVVTPRRSWVSARLSLSSCSLGNICERRASASSFRRT